MRRGCLWALIVAVTLLGTSCETYRAQFGETASSIDARALTLRLDFSGGKRITLPDDVDKLKRLRMLNLSDNPGLDLAATLTRVCALPKLSTLLLEGMAMSELPDAIQRCRSLTSLSLARNPKLRLPDALTKLAGSKIQFLNLSENKLSRLPKEIRGLERLEDLRLSHNEITDLETFEYLSSLPELYTLWLDHNQYANVPESVGSLQQIRYLFLDHNEITMLPAAMTNMRRLKVIHLNHNRLRALPERMLDMPNLLMAFLSSNAIQHISPRFETESYFLRGIVLDDNCLSADQAVRAAKQFRHFFMFSAGEQRMRIGVACGEVNAATTNPASSLDG